MRLLHSQLLRYLDEVARAGSIRKASAKLNIASSSINRQILALEAELGNPIFHRLHRRLRLTPVGEILIDHVRRTLKDLGLAVGQIEDLKGIRRGEVTVALVGGVKIGSSFMGLVVALELDPMTQDEKLFFKQLGARIAALRKDQAMTQVQLAETMDVSQQTVASWEVGRRGVPVSNLPLLARTLGVGGGGFDRGEDATREARPHPEAATAGRAAKPPPAGQAARRDGDAGRVSQPGRTHRIIAVSVTKAKRTIPIVVDQIGRSILILRGQRVILDRELAAIYGSTTKRLNEQIKRNRDRFPEDFMFQLTAEEADRSRSQIATLKSGRGQNLKYRPYAFTEHGAIQAANVLNSPRAIAMESTSCALSCSCASCSPRTPSWPASSTNSKASLRTMTRPSPPPKRRGIGFTANIDEKP